MLFTCIAAGFFLLAALVFAASAGPNDFKLSFFTDPECRSQQQHLLTVINKLSADSAAASALLGNQLDTIVGVLSELRQSSDKTDLELAKLSDQVLNLLSLASQLQFAQAQSTDPSKLPHESPATVKKPPAPESPKALESPEKVKQGKSPSSETKPHQTPPIGTDPTKPPSPSQPPKPQAKKVSTPPAAAPKPLPPGKNPRAPAAGDASPNKPAAPPPQQVLKPGAAGGIKVMSEADVKRAERESQPLVRPGTRSDRSSTVLYGIRPKKIFQDGRRIPPVKLERIIQAPGSSVEVYMFDELLSDAESDGLAAAHFKQLESMGQANPIVCFQSEAAMLRALQGPGDASRLRRKLSAADFTPGTRCLNSSLSLKAASWLHFNWTRSTMFYPGESRFTGHLAARFLKSMGLPESHAGKLEVTSHPSGQGLPERLVDCRLSPYAVVRVFLDTVSQGGEFHLPRLGIWLRPRKSRALLVTGMSPEGRCELEAAFNSTQVLSGRRVMLSQIYHYETFPGIGQRPVEPSIPPRPPGTPVVYCDSTGLPCRWSDEWTDEHLI